MKFFALLSTLSVLTLSAAEIVFVPGWFSENDNQRYELLLNKCFPGDKITVLSWKSNQGVWKNAVAAADTAVPQVAEYICSKTPAEQSQITLIGHSLGGRVIIKTAGILAQKQIRINRMIFLGAAVDFDTDLTAVAKVSTGKNINIFSRNDSVLKFLYSNVNRKLALGFCGAETLPANFAQYSFQTSELKKSNVNAELALIEFCNHLCSRYISELSAILAGKKSPYKPEYDYSKVSLKSNLKLLDHIVLPPVPQIEVIDSYANWNLCGIKIKYSTTDAEGRRTEYSKMIYFISDHYGRFRRWHLSRVLLQKEFNRVKKEIVKIR